MEIKHQEYYFKSNTGICTIYVQSWVPEGEVRAVVQIHHGMAEKSDRYKFFAEHLCGKGFAVFAHDMANHGKSNHNIKETGYFGKKDGWLGLVEDMKDTYDIAKSEFPDVPYFVLGHSMGSLIARCFIVKYGSLIDGALICGTSGKNYLSGVLSAFSIILSKTLGNKFKSRLLKKAIFNSYNNGFEDRTEYDWLTKDDDIVDEYIDDEMCGFIFSAKGYNDLAKILKNVSSKKWYENVPKDLPIYIFSGQKDPVGNYGKGVKEVYEKLKKTGHNVKLRLYPNGRHEMLNETNKDTVFKELLAFIDKVLSGELTTQ